MAAVRLRRPSGWVVAGRGGRFPRRGVGSRAHGASSVGSENTLLTIDSTAQGRGGLIVDPVE